MTGYLRIVRGRGDAVSMGSFITGFLVTTFALVFYYFVTIPMGAIFSRAYTPPYVTLVFIAISIFVGVIAGYSYHKCFYSKKGE
jgi:predicted membrane-bound spermidine synthase